MAMNSLAGAGPQPVAAGSNPGPSPGLSGTLGQAPQAAPSQVPNMLSGAPGAPQGQPGQAPQGQPQGQQPMGPPPSRETLSEMLQKTGYIQSALKTLLGKQDLAAKDVITVVGNIVAEGVMDPFMAAKYLTDLPAGSDPLQIRQWVGAHYAQSSQTLGKLSEMLHAHGAMTRRQAPMQPQPGQTPPDDAMPQNRLSLQ